MRRLLSEPYVLRTVESEADARKLVDFCNIVFSGTDPPDPRIGIWSADLLAPGNHSPLNRTGYFLVEDTTSGQIVFLLNLIPQTWTYEGVPFGVGRIELVGACSRTTAAAD